MHNAVHCEHCSYPDTKWNINSDKPTAPCLINVADSNFPDFSVAISRKVRSILPASVRLRYRRQGPVHAARSAFNIKCTGTSAAAWLPIIIWSSSIYRPV